MRLLRDWRRERQMIRHRKISYKLQNGEVGTRCYLYETKEQYKGVCQEHNGKKAKDKRR